MQARDEYFRFIEQIIERDRDLITREELLKLGNEAAERAMARSETGELTLELLQDEVDRLISRRLNLPSYQAWLKGRDGG